MLYYFLLLICLFGYCLFISRNRNIAFACTPALTISVLMLALFIGGICRILQITSRILYLLGIALCIYECISFIIKRERRRVDVRIVVQAGLWIIGVSALYFYIMKDKYFLFAYDDFSHWGKVTRVLLETNHFPLASDANVISFRSYPVGAAAFMYFCCKHLHLSGSNALLWGQACAVFSFYFSLFSCIRSKNWILFTVEHAVCAILVTSLTGFNIKLNYLQVDNLVSSIMLSCIILAFSYFDGLEKRCLEMGLISGACITVKTSGMLILVFLLYIAYRLYEANAKVMEKYYREMIHYQVLQTGEPPKKPNRVILPYAILLGIPLFVFFIWKVHGFLTFSLQGISGGKHSGSLAALASTMGDGRDRLEKSKIILPYFFGMKTNRAIVPVFWIILLPVVKIFMEENVREAYRANRKLVSYACITVAFYLIYELSLFMMYLFSMSLSEMIHENGSDYSRYNNTIVAVVTGITFFLTIQECESRKMRHTFSWVVACIGVFVVGFGVNFQTKLMWGVDGIRNTYPDLNIMESIMECGTIKADDRILVRYQKKYSIPTNGANYYLYPCTNYTLTYDKESFKTALESQNYAMIIDLVNGSIQDQNGKRTIDQYLEAF